MMVFTAPDDTRVLLPAEAGELAVTLEGFTDGFRDELTIGQIEFLVVMFDIHSHQIMDFHDKIKASVLAAAV